MNAGFETGRAYRPALTSPPLLQRKCFCGGASGLTGSCSDCENKKLLGKPVQHKLRINEPGDVHEQEADRVAEQVMQMVEPGKDMDSTAPTAPLVQRRVTGTSTAGIGAAPPIVNEVLSSPGKPLDLATHAFFAPRFGYDFGKVRVHSDRIAGVSAAAVNALAYTVGDHIVLGSEASMPTSAAARHVLGHELVHVVQQSRSSGSSHLQRLAPEDVSEELVGQTFVVSGPVALNNVTFSGGELVAVESWKNQMHNVRVRLLPPHPEAGLVVSIAKTKILPKAPNVFGVTPYSAGAAAKAQAVERAEGQLAGEQSRAEPRADEIARLLKDQPVHWHSLNRKLIQETMFNRLDVSIRLWTDYYNTLFHYYPQDPLDANLVKAMLYEESKMGTSGKHLELTPHWAARSRFNVGQVIDTSGSALLIMMREMAPEIITDFGLENIEADLADAQRDLATLPAKADRTPDEDRRLNDVQLIQSYEETQHMSFSELFLLSYKMSGGVSTEQFDRAATRFFAEFEPGHPKRGEDYDFWLRAAVRWLFEKRATVKSWGEAVQAYNGLDKGTGYRDRVVGRASASKRAAAAGESFMPHD